MSGDILKIIILDSGCNDNSLFRNKNIELYNDDDCGHGTAINGIIANYLTNDDVVINIKVADGTGQGKLDDLIKILNRCIEEEPDIINMSFGFTTNNKEIHYLIKQLDKKGVKIFSASGNNRTDKYYPADYKQVISVGAKLKSGKIAPWSAPADIYECGYNIFSIDTYHTGTSFACAVAVGKCLNILRKKNMKRTELLKYLKEDNQ